MTSQESACRVTKDGRLILPRELVQKLGGKPGDLVEIGDIELRRASWTRRAAIKAIWLTTGAAIARVADFIEIASFFEESSVMAAQTDQELMQRLFGISRHLHTALVPARNHPFRELSDDEPVYPIEAECCRAYMERPPMLGS